VLFSAVDDLYFGLATIYASSGGDEVYFLVTAVSAGAGRRTRRLANFSPPRRHTHDRKRRGAEEEIVVVFEPGFVVTNRL
jgi:hypothetical protein